MRKLSLTLLTIAVLLGIVGCGESSVDWEDLVQRDTLYYKKFSEIPFGGEITEFSKRTYKNGKKIRG